MSRTGAGPDVTARDAGALPSISLVTISYNQAGFLAECLDSVLAQKTRGVEYVVVDPGSTDGSRDIIRARADRIDCIVLEPDAGPADGLNRGFAQARGEVFGYVNADDRLVHGAIDWVRRFFAAHPQVDVLCGAIRIVDRDGRVALRRRTPDRFDLRRFASGLCTIGQQGTFFRSSVFAAAGGFNAANRISWDGELLVDMALAGARFRSTSKVLGDFRIYPESITGSRRHEQRLLAEHGRLAQKIARVGVPLYGPLEARLQRALYRINPLRHARYLLAR